MTTNCDYPAIVGSQIITKTFAAIVMTDTDMWLVAEHATKQLPLDYTDSWNHIEWVPMDMTIVRYTNGRPDRVCLIDKNDCIAWLDGKVMLTDPFHSIA